MKYILISVIDREIYTEQFDNLGKAKEALAFKLKQINFNHLRRC